VLEYLDTEGRPNVAVALPQLGELVMATAKALWMLSFSPIDQLLYGAFKLNWIGDIGSAALVGGCAPAYSLILIVPPAGSKPVGPASACLQPAWLRAMIAAIFRLALPSP
jgi:hypothetical protein